MSLWDIDHIEAILREAARAGHALSYSEMLMALGYRFTRPKMRAPMRGVNRSLRCWWCGNPMACPGKAGGQGAQMDIPAHGKVRVPRLTLK